MSSTIQLTVKDMAEIEEETLTHLLTMENEFRSYYSLLLKELNIQKELTERMWFLSQRYTIFVTSGPCCKFNEGYSAPGEDVILQEYHDKLQSVRSSNCHLWHALRAIRYSCLHFEELCSKLDMTRETPLIIGDAFHKPITYFIELIDDLFKYLHSLLLSLKYKSHQMDPGYPLSLEEYKQLLDPSEDFEEYLMQGLTYCKCLRPKQVCETKKLCSEK